ncbi:MAG TPA: MaoC family dehydratase N-terminal domain-containing protein [Xanthomonadales bacterium]|nr:MaoC family dehydratase N-terminal domain-containing protein [Xanthomonadales bacterium]
MTKVDLQIGLGRCETASEPVGSWRAGAMAALLDRPIPEPGSSLPMLWHWMYSVTTVPQARLAGDGHPKRGDFIPCFPQTSRMWAGSKLELLGDIRIGDELNRKSEIVDIRETSGSSGEIVWVTLENAYSTQRGLAVREYQDIVYRHAPRGDHKLRNREPIRIGIEARRTVSPDERLLFRFSALTFNAHRIHYDLAYAQNVEGYPGLLVHGPLLATLLMDLWEENPRRPVLRSLQIRALAPAFAGEQLELCIGEPAAEHQTLWVQRQNGNAVMRIELDF